MKTTKSFDISKQAVWEAYKRVKANRGAAGVDEQSIQEFEINLKDNLYKLWNRMSSGSYFPCPVRRVEIPKSDGGQRPLGIATVTDRIAQTVVKMELEPEVEPYFHPDSYGYRPGKSALEAVRQARQRCWHYDWAIDLDIRGFFDNVDHELLLRAVKAHTECKWMRLYIERWLKAPVELPQGDLVPSDKGIPQGSVVGPLLANLFLHYAFDRWMSEHHPSVPFERYADDCLVHCTTEAQAIRLMDAIARRLAECKLELHPDKSKIVYCQDGLRKQDYPRVQFDFLGYGFQPRQAKARWGNLFLNFSPAISTKAAKSIRKTIRSWKIHRWTQLSIEELAASFNPVIRGWINYYGRFYPSKLSPIFGQLDYALARWARQKYKRLKGSHTQAREWLRRLARNQPRLFEHWRLTLQPTAGR